MGEGKGEEGKRGGSWFFKLVTQNLSRACICPSLSIFLFHLSRSLLHGELAVSLLFFIDKRVARQALGRESSRARVSCSSSDFGAVRGADNNIFSSFSFFIFLFFFLYLEYLFLVYHVLYLNLFEKFQFSILLGWLGAFLCFFISLL